MVLSPALLCLSLLRGVAAQAPPPAPLVVAVDGASPQLQVWWRDGELRVLSQGHPPEPPLAEEAPLDADATQRPLEGTAAAGTPRAREGWTDLVPADCPQPGPVRSHLDQDGHRLEAHSSAAPDDLQVAVSVDGVTVAAAGLGRPAQACALFLGQADRLPGPELILIWQPTTGTSWGLTVWHLPEAAFPAQDKLRPD